jgi:hypothetical protein
MREQYLVLDDDSNIVWTGLHEPTEVVMNVLKTLLPGMVFTTYAVHHVLSLTLPVTPH